MPELKTCHLILIAALGYAPAQLVAEHPTPPQALVLRAVTGSIIAEPVLQDIKVPAAIEFLSDDTALVAQRSTGTLTRVNFSSGERADIIGLDGIFTEGDAGLHDIELHPDYASNGWIYLSYSEGDAIRSTVALDRVRIDADRIAERQRIFTADAWSEMEWHCGARIQFQQGYLFLTIGDRAHPERAQDRSNHAGSILRLHDDGRVPDDNPFIGAEVEGSDPPLPETWSYGHRNPQGLFVHPESGDLWATEHGPRGGDEMNRIQRGANYGWPVLSFGFEYDGGPIGKGIVFQEGMTQPAWVWVPSIAPSDLLIYTGAAFPAWQGSFLVGAMAQVHLNRLVLRDGIVVLEERLGLGQLGRVRSIAADPEGLVYLGSDSGIIWRLKPQ